MIAATADHVLLEVSGVQHRFDVARAGGVVWVDSALGAVALTPLERLPAPAVAGEPGSLLAPMPGTLVRAEVSSGDPVAAGQPVLVLEAMKMEHLILAPAGGVLAELRVKPGTQVDAGDVLAIVTGEDAMTGLVRRHAAGQLADHHARLAANPNALSTALLTQLRAALTGAVTDPAVRVIVLTGCRAGVLRRRRPEGELAAASRRRAAYCRRSSSCSGTAPSR